MSRKIFWNEAEIKNKIIKNEEGCKYKVNNICFNNMSKMLGKKCHGCKDYKEE